MEEVGHAANETRVRNAGLLAIDAEGNLLYGENNTIRRIVDAAA